MMALVFVSIATFGHQSWSANFLTLPADLFPKRMVASAYGLAGMCGVLGGAAFTRWVGATVDSSGYVLIFTTVGLMHILATFILVVSIRPRAVVAREAFPALVETTEK
jgi:ACS family hexuronate transporter-like MFS transporter